MENFAFLLSARRDLCRGERLGERTGGGGGSRGETEVDGVGGEEVLLGLESKQRNESGDGVSEGEERKSQSKRWTNAGRFYIHSSCVL